MTVVWKCALAYFLKYSKYPCNSWFCKFAVSIVFIPRLISPCGQLCGVPFADTTRFSPITFMFISTEKEPLTEVNFSLFMVCYKIENQSLSLSLPCCPTKEQHWMWDHKHINLFQNCHGGGGGVMKLVKISFPALRNDKFIDLGWEPKILLFLFDF